MKDTSPKPVFYDNKGNLVSDERYTAAGRYFRSFIPLIPDNLIPMPEDTILFRLPERKPVVFDKNLQPLILEDRIPVAAFIPPGFTQTLLCSYIKPDHSNLILPLFSYTAIGLYKDRLYVSAIHIDKDTRHKISMYDEKTILKKGEILLKTFPQNRLLVHLIENCAIKYKCPNARNLIMNRSEAPLPVSRSCNSGCLGCISYQEKSSAVKSSQERLRFIPTEDELFEIAEYHIRNVKKPIVSFGQGCEGEPLLLSELIARVIRKIKAKYRNVTININTNGYSPEALCFLFRCGLDSARISINSAQEELYTKYYRPKGYLFSDVVKSIELGKKLKKWISLNYFVFPGITDTMEEYQSLCKLIKRCKPSMLQLRNFNIDPDWYIDSLKIGKPKMVLGIKKLIKLLSSDFPSLKFGYFNPYLK